MKCCCKPQLLILGLSGFDSWLMKQRYTDNGTQNTPP